MVAMLYGDMIHNYLGRKFPGDSNSRTVVEIMHCIQGAWHKFHQHKLISDIVEPTRVSQIAVEIISRNCFSDSNVWFGFTAADAKKIAQSGRGTTADAEVYCWLGSHTWYQPWEITMRRMNQRLEHAASSHPVQSWSNQYFINQYRLASKIVFNQCAGAATAIAWMLVDDWVHNFPSAPSTNRGRPPKRWDQALTAFSSTDFGERNWLKAAQS